MSKTQTRSCKFRNTGAQTLVRASNADKQASKQAVTRRVWHIQMHKQTDAHTATRQRPGFMAADVVVVPPLITSTCV